MKTVTTIASGVEKEAIWTPNLNNTGYRSVKIGGKTILVSRLIAASFKGQPLDETWVCMHMDFNTTNNDVVNVNFGTQKQNMADCQDYHCPGRNKKVDSRPIRANGRWMTHESRNAAAAKRGVYAQHISKCLKGTAKSTGGFQFRLTPVPNLPEEEWKDVEDSDGLKVSNMGRLKRKDGSLYVPSKPRQGTPYLRVSFRGKSYKVHRIVAKHFCGPHSPEQDQVHHKNGNTYDNSASNLEWLTVKQHNKITNKTKIGKTPIKKDEKSIRGEEWRPAVIPVPWRS